MGTLAALLELAHDAAVAVFSRAGGTASDDLLADAWDSGFVAGTLWAPLPSDAVPHLELNPYREA